MKKQSKKEGKLVRAWALKCNNGWDGEKFIVFMQFNRKDLSESFEEEIRAKEFKIVRVEIREV